MIGTFKEIELCGGPVDGQRSRVASSAIYFCVPVPILPGGFVEASRSSPSNYNIAGYVSRRHEPHKFDFMGYEA